MEDHVKVYPAVAYGIAIRSDRIYIYIYTAIAMILAVYIFSGL